MFVARSKSVPQKESNPESSTSKKRKLAESKSDRKKPKFDDFEVVPQTTKSVDEKRVEPSNMDSFINDLLKKKSNKHKESSEHESTTPKFTEKTLARSFASTMEAEMKGQFEGDTPQATEEMAEERNARTIYVSGLQPDMTDSQLQKKFKKFGKIEEVRYNKELTSAWIRFESTNAAETAAKNEVIKIGEVDVSVEKAKLQKKEPINDNATIFVRNLSFETTNETLNKFFSDCGAVLWVRIPKFADTGKARGVAYVSFESEDSVPKALEKTGSEIDKRTITVQKSDREQKSKPLTGKYDKTVFVGNIAYAVTKEKLQAYFEKNAGIITALRMPMNEETGSSKGHAFIEFKHDEGVEKALKQNGKVLEGKTLRVDHGSRDKAEVAAKKSTNNIIYVRNMSFNTDTKKLKEFFGKCGKILQVKIPTFEDSGKSRGIAYIEFETDESAKKALEFEQSTLDGRRINISISLKPIQ